MYWTDRDAYMVSELKLPRLVADLTVAQPKAADEYRIIILGSSETWGYLNHARDTWPVLLDEMGLQTPDNRRVRVYNLAYPGADSMKDLLLAQFIVDYSLQPDVIVWAVNSNTFDPNDSISHLLRANPDLALQVVERYNLIDIPLDDVRATAALRGWRRQTFFEERDHVAYWLLNQINGIFWAIGNVDYPIPAVVPRRSSAVAEPRFWTNHRPGSLEALVDVVQSRNIGFAVLATPANYRAPDFTSWLAESLRSRGIRFLDCTALLPFHEFTNTNLHFSAHGHRLLAEQVAQWLRQEQFMNGVTEREDSQLSCVEPA
jgi:hypothetical protein